MAKQKVSFSGREIDGQTLEADEKALLRYTVMEYMAGGNAFLKDIFGLEYSKPEDQNSIIGAAMVAKDKFSAPIKGMMASDSEVAVQLLRPGHILRDTTTAETPINTWDSDSITSGAFASGNDYWIGSGSANSTAAVVSQYLVLLLLGIWWTQGGSPTVEEVYITIGNTLYPIFVLRQGWLADNPNRIRGVRLPPLLAEARQSISAQVRSSVAGRQELVLLGLALGPGRYLRKQSYAAADLP